MIAVHFCFTVSDQKEEAIFVYDKEHLGHKFNFKISDPELKFYFFYVLKAL